FVFLVEEGFEMKTERIEKRDREEQLQYFLLWFA
ncbi:MAG: hypothetical protein ACJAXX_001903, partial [Roseivirga sp.]